MRLIRSGLPDDAVRNVANDMCDVVCDVTDMGLPGPADDRTEQYSGAAEGFAEEE